MYTNNKQNKISEKLNPKELIQLVSPFMKSFFETQSFSWEKFLSPYVYSFCEYYNTLKNEKLEEYEKKTFKIPYGNNDFLGNLEQQREYYHLIAQGKLDTALESSACIADPTDQYIDKYVFPYSDISEIAFLSFCTFSSKELFYLQSFLNIKKIEFNHFQNKKIEVSKDARDDLVDYLVQKVGAENHERLKLFVYCMPSIYFENFNFYYTKASQELLKVENIKVIFFIRHFIFNPTFLMFLSMKKNNEKMKVTFQHGADYGQILPPWTENVEKIFCDKFLTWGYSYDSKDLSFISLRFKKQLLSLRYPKKNKKKILLVLRLAFREEILQAMKNTFHILSLALKKDDLIYVRFSPRELNKESIIKTLESYNINFRIDESKSSLVDCAYNYETLIFNTPNTTGYLELLNLGFYPKIISDEKDIKLREGSRLIYRRLKEEDIWIDYDNVTRVNIDEPFNKKQKKVINLFKNMFIRTSFFPALKLNYLLLKLKIKHRRLN